MKKIGTAIIYFLSLLLFGGCVTLELPVSPQAGGEWQRPLDLRLNTVQSKAKSGSLTGLKLKIECGRWDSEKQTSTLSSDPFCQSLKKTFVSYGATIDQDEFDLNVRVLRGEDKSISCGLGGWFTYMTVGIFPCKTQQWSEGNLQFLNRSGAVIAHYPLNFRRLKYFGWMALYAIETGNTLQREFDDRLRRYAINRAYTLAVQKNWIAGDL